MGLTLDPILEFTEEDVRQYATKNGNLAALEWLVLIPPEKFDGDWQRTYYNLESAIYWGNNSEYGKKGIE